MANCLKMAKVKANEHVSCAIRNHLSNAANPSQAIVQALLKTGFCKTMGQDLGAESNPNPESDTPDNNSQTVTAVTQAGGEIDDND